MNQTMLRPRGNQVINGHLALQHGVLFVLHLDLKVPLGLVIITQVIGPFGQQVSIHRVLFKNRNLLLQHLALKLRTTGLHLHNGAGVEREARRGVVLVQRFQRHRGTQPVLILILQPDVIHGGAGPPLRDAAIPGQQEIPPLRRLVHRLGGQHGRVARDFRSLITPSFPRFDDESDLHLLVSGFIVQTMRDLRLEVAVCGQELADARFGNQQLFFVERGTQAELRRACHLPGRGRVRQL